MSGKRAGVAIGYLLSMMVATRPTMQLTISDFVFGVFMLMIVMAIKP